MKITTITKEDGLIHSITLSIELPKGRSLEIALEPKTQRNPIASVALNFFESEKVAVQLCASNVRGSVADELFEIFEGLAQKV